MTEYRSGLLLCALCLASLGAVASAEVVVLNTENFNEQVANGVWFVKFYAPWCGYCKRLAPTWTDLADKVAGKANIAKIDCVAGKNNIICNKYEITGYPTLKLFKDGKVVADYAGDRSLEDLERFALQLSGQEAEAKPERKIETKPATRVLAEKQPPRVILNPKGEVTELTAANIAESVSRGPWLVEFFAPWCGHCKKLAPIWDALAAKMQNKMNIAKVDCTLHSSVCESYGVKGYPTLKYIRDGHAEDYRGARTLEALEEFAERMTRPAVEIFEPAQLDEIRSKEVAFIYLYNTPKELESFTEIANRWHAKTHFYASSDDAVLPSFSVATKPSLVVYRDKLFRKFDGNLDDVAAIHRWIDTNKYPLVPQLDSGNAQEYLGGSKNVAILFLDPSSPQKQAALSELETVARGLENAYSNLAFVWMDAVQWASYASRNYDVNTLPSLAVVNSEHGIYFDVDLSGQKVPIKAAQMRIFILESLSGNLKGKPIGGFFTGLMRSAQKGMERIVIFVNDYVYFFAGLFIAFLIWVAVFLYRTSSDGPSSHRQGGEKRE